jgi:hypothetical protein
MSSYDMHMTTTLVNCGKLWKFTYWWRSLTDLLLTIKLFFIYFLLTHKTTYFNMPLPISVNKTFNKFVFVDNKIIRNSNPTQNLHSDNSYPSSPKPSLFYCVRFQFKVLKSRLPLMTLLLKGGHCISY